jgi:Fe-S-cluster containining protein
MTSLPVLAPDCRTYPCHEECCSAGVDVFPPERERMLRDGIATEADFTGPETDEEGDVLFRTALGPRGCVFLREDRGCRLHAIGYKPEVCVEVPRDDEEVAEMAELGMLPCHRAWKW